MNKLKFRCVECGEYHDGECNQNDKLAFALDCCFDALDECLGIAPEPGGRLWLIMRGEYPPDARPTGMF